MTTREQSQKKEMMTFKWPGKISRTLPSVLCGGQKRERLCRQREQCKLRHGEVTSCDVLGRDEQKVSQELLEPSLTVKIY